MHLDKVKGNSTDVLLLNLNNSIRQAVKIHAPIKENLLHNRNGKPWYDEELRSDHRVVWNCENISRKYKMSYQWKAFQSERRKYMNLLESKRVDYMWSEIRKHQYDSKQLYKLVPELTGKKIENPMPESLSDMALAEKFASFFNEKNWNNLDQYPLYTPPVQPILHYFKISSNYWKVMYIN